MSKFSNSAQKQFLSTIPTKYLEDSDEFLSKRCKFNFHYLDRNQGTRFNELNSKQQQQLWSSLKLWSEKSLKEWETEERFVIYGKFPVHSKFTRPRTIPLGVDWARFRLQGRFRLAGFVIPESLNEKRNKGTEFLFDSNCFYIVFIDPLHEFYPVKKK